MRPCRSSLVRLHLLQLELELELVQPLVAPVWEPQLELRPQEQPSVS